MSENNILTLNPIFATPIGMRHIKEIPNSEHEQVLALQYEDLSDSGFPLTSKDRTVLEYTPNIRMFIEETLKEYAPKTLATNKPLKITSSWATKHINMPQFTFRHAHPNSIVSGTYYVKASANHAEPIQFMNFNPIENFVQWEMDKELLKNNQWANKVVKFPCMEGLLLLYPSWLNHGVDGASSNNVRCSISFNTQFIE
jgi:hypothetical protein